MAVDDLTETLTEEELFDQFATDAATLEYPVDVQGMQPERVARAWLQVEAKSHEQYQIKRKAIVDSGWRQTAKGDSLTMFARGYHQIERYPATQAIHQFRLTDTGGVGPVNVAAGERVAYASNGQEFRNVDALVVPLNSYVDGNWKAEEAGALGNVGIGTVTALRAPIVGVAVTNPAISGEASSIVTAGRDAETDEQLGQRLDDHWGSVGSGGNEAAYRFWVTESFDVDSLTSSITRIKILTNNPYGPGSIGVIIANASGTATGAEITRVDDYLQDRKALGSGELQVLSATAQSELVSGTVRITPGYVAADVVTEIEEALDSYESEFAIGGTLYRSELIQRVMGVDGVYDFTLVDPVANVTISDTAIVSFTYDFDTV